MIFLHLLSPPALFILPSHILFCLLISTESLQHLKTHILDPEIIHINFEIVFKIFSHVIFSNILIFISHSAKLCNLFWLCAVTHTHGFVFVRRADIFIYLVVPKKFFRSKKFPRFMFFFCLSGVVFFLKWNVNMISIFILMKVTNILPPKTVIKYISSIQRFFSKPYSEEIFCAEGAYIFLFLHCHSSHQLLSKFWFVLHESVSHCLCYIFHSQRQRKDSGVPPWLRLGGDAGPAGDELLFFEPQTFCISHGLHPPSKFRLGGPCFCYPKLRKPFPCLVVLVSLFHMLNGAECIPATREGKHVTPS